MTIIQTNPDNLSELQPVCGEFDLFFLFPSSRAVSEQPEWPDCKLHGDWTQAPGAGGACFSTSWEGDAAEVHDPDEAPPCGCTGTGNSTI